MVVRLFTCSVLQTEAKSFEENCVRLSVKISDGIP